jgi:hypothetical protein
MPTRIEAIGKVIALALSPAQRLMAQVIAPAATIAGQVKTLTERPTESNPAESNSAPAESNPAPAQAE